MLQAKHFCTIKTKPFLCHILARPSVGFKTIASDLILQILLEKLEQQNNVFVLGCILPPQAKAISALLARATRLVRMKKKSDNISQY